MEMLSTNKDVGNVCNVKVKYIRPTFNNLEEWMNNPNNVYIGRARIVFIDKQRYPPIGSIFENPYKVGKDGDLDTVLNLYEVYIEQKLKDKGVMEEFLKLKGKNLGCWCHPNKCHGDILLKLIDKYRNFTET